MGVDGWHDSSHYICPEETRRLGAPSSMWSLLALTRLMNMFNGTRGSRLIYGTDSFWDGCVYGRFIHLYDPGKYFNELLVTKA
ncbi:Hypothetical protein FKW44_000185, partial [Caligus rogercresseyi]